MIGLDIGSKTIKIVELVKEGNTLRLAGSGIVGYSLKDTEGGLSAQAGSAVQAYEEKESALISETIKKLHSQAKISGREVTVALPETQVFTRTVKLPPLTDQEVASAIKWEAEQYIPIPLAEAISQHQILERRQGAAPEVVVLLVAAPRNLVEKYINIVSAAGLAPVAVETELIALVRALAPIDKTALLADFGARSTDIAIAKNGNLYFSRSIATGGEAFTRAVSTALGIPYVQAEEYKRAYGLSESELEGKIRSAIEPVFRIVTEEIKKAIHFYQSEEGGEVPSSVILSGGTSVLPDAAATLTKLLGIEVVFGNPFAKVSMDEEAAKALAPYASLYSIAVGSAEREV